MAASIPIVTSARRCRCWMLAQGWAANPAQIVSHSSSASNAFCSSSRPFPRRSISQGRRYSSSAAQDESAFQPRSPRLRFAPSPTGHLHLGGLRTALMNHLFARRWKGKWVLRIEDTDQTRLVAGATEALQETLRWSGLHYDEGPEVGGQYGPYVQSERLEIYKRYAQQLLDAGHAYRDFRPQVERSISEGRFRSAYLPPSEEEAAQMIKDGKEYVVRLKAARDPISHTDLVYGALHFPLDNMGDDLVLLKSNGWPTYHLANVVDDHEMRITHVFRGEEWLPSLPKHLSIYAALGIKPPHFAHLPLLINPDGSKLSKRTGDTRVEDYREKGYEPEALLNFIALLGYNHHGAIAEEEKSGGAGANDDREVIPLQQLIEKFSLHNVSHSRASLSLPKLKFLNRKHLRIIVSRGSDDKEREAVIQRLRTLVKASYTDVPSDLLEDNYLAKVAELMSERTDTVPEIAVQAKFLFVDLDYTTKEARDLTAQFSPEQYTQALTATLSALENLSTSSSTDAVDPPAMTALLKRIVPTLPASGKDKPKLGTLMKPLRHALTAAKFGPNVNEVLALLGPERASARIRKALEAQAPP